jgi:L-malate glycosyltransferase
MKITMVVAPYPWRPLGAACVAYEYGNRLVARGHEVTVVHASHLARGSPMPPPRGVARRLLVAAHELRNLLFKPRVRWHFVDPRIRLLYVKEPFARNVPDADAVIASVWGTAEYVRDYPREKGEKFNLIQHYAVVFGNDKEQVHAIWKAPMHTILISKWLYAIAEEIGCKDIRLIPIGLDTSKFHLIRPLTDRPLSVAMLYHAAKWKGSADGIRALEITRQKYPQLRAVFFSQARPGVLPEWAEFHRDPPQDYLVKEIYNGCRIYLCPSWSEGFPAPPMEAMAGGCALVTTDNGGVVEYAEHEKTALVSPPRNPEALAANLVRILDDDALRMRLAEAGRKRMDDFPWEKSAAELEKALQECVQQRG